MEDEPRVPEFGSSKPRRRPNSFLSIFTLFLRLVRALWWSMIIGSRRSTQSLVRVIRPPAAAAAAADPRLLLVNIWSTDSLQECVANLISCFKKINRPIRIEDADTPNGSGCSSPTRFEFGNTNRVASDIENYNDRRHPFKSLLLLDKGGNLIDHISLLQLIGMIHKQSGITDYQQIDLCRFFEDNSSVLDSFLYDHFNSAVLSIDAWICPDDFQFTFESAKRCVMILKVASGLICLMKQELDEVKCVLFCQNVKDCYFRLCVGRPMEKLIDAAYSISKLKWSTSDIYQMLVLYEAINDVLRSFCYPRESDGIFQEMRISFKRIFDEIESFICAKLNGSPCKMTHIGHPVTKFLVQSMALFVGHKSVVQLICVSDPTCSLGHLLPKAIRHWAKELKRHSDSFVDEGGNYIFLLNNLALFSLEAGELLKVLLPDSERCEILDFLESLIKNYTVEYLKCWDPVRNYVELNPGRKPLKALKSKYYSIYSRQQSWVLETNLKRSLREEIKDHITPPVYCTILKEPPCRFGQSRNKSREKLLLEDLFESEHMDESRVCCVLLH